ncbi:MULTISPECIES: phosphoadenosine phosphosulfate reductase family protein [unclassified Streptomyces]|uniref:phosphoadenosine phosphosulfate reductase family protein n=1 Tax=unclassified Streptomyces TaxID=2593676 RepID=UPI002E299B2F|nr:MULTISPECIES: phosphoadenosine phosphosulfate reductase family protein [unclassified Streptomyces]
MAFHSSPSVLVPLTPVRPTTDDVAQLAADRLASADEPDPTLLLTWADVILFNHSGGKDSQAMLSHLFSLAVAAQVVDRIVVVHCDLGDVEWKGTRELAEEQAAAYGLRFEVVSRAQGDLIQQIKDRHHTLRAKGDTTTPAWPSSQARYCTSAQKRGQVRPLMTRLVDEFGGRLGRPVRILNCMGMRAEESPARKKRTVLELDQGASNGKRTVYTWLPLHAWTVKQVWSEIARSGLPYSPVYDWGMSRLSCSFCVLASEGDLELAARLRPEKAAEMVGLEQYVGHDFKKNLPIAEIVRRAEAVDAAEGPAVRHPRGTAMAAQIGDARTLDYLLRLTA